MKEEIAGPTAWKLLGIWALIGAQSFGGGPTTLQSIRREMTLKRGWITEMEFVHFWTLSSLVPGINMLSFAIQIGRKLAGWRGIAATLIGLLLPSTLITVAITAGFSAVQNWPPFQAMLRGILPAAAGLMFVTFLQMTRPLLRESRRQGWASLGVSLGFIGVTAAMIGLLRWPVWLALLLAMLSGVLLVTLPLPGRSQLQNPTALPSQKPVLESLSERPSPVEQQRQDIS